MIKIPFATPPVRHPPSFDRITLPRIRSVENGETQLPDIRQILSDNAIRDMLTDDDAAFIRAVAAATPPAVPQTVDPPARREGRLTEFFAYETMGAAMIDRRLLQRPI